MKRLLIGLLALGSVSTFASVTKCQTRMSYNEYKNRDINSRAIMDKMDISYEECVLGAVGAHNWNTAVGHKDKMVVIFSDVDGKKRKIVLKD
ncbi:MAG: hypothetical protein ACOYL6_09040 [Bacteriovoracaceae bacterium]